MGKEEVGGSGVSVFRVGDTVKLRYHSDRIGDQWGEVTGFWRGRRGTVEVRFGHVHYAFFADELELVDMAAEVTRVKGEGTGLSRVKGEGTGR